MSDVKRCDICGEIFEFHSGSYHPTQLPVFDVAGIKQNNCWNREIAGSHSVKYYDTCTVCFNKIVKFLKALKRENNEL
jgi:hypothetical protein